jgi:hypothetical protein
MQVYRLRLKRFTKFKADVFSGLYLMKNSKFLCSVVLASAMAQSVAAQSEEPKVSQLDLTQKTIDQITRDPRGFTEQTIRQLFQYAPSGELTREAIEVHAAMNAAGRRANHLRNVLAFDLDADMAISASEIERQTPFLNANQSVLLQTVLATSDRDRDGSLSLTELWQNAMSSSLPSPKTQHRIEAVLQFDANKDGKVTPDEIAIAVEQIANAEVSPNVIPPANIRRQQAQPAQLCEFPKPTANAEIILVGGYQGYAISNIAVSGLDRETSAAEIHIEDGETPLYILATTFDPIVWKVTGDTDRVERFVAPRDTRGVGVAGLKKDVLHFEPGNRCLPKYFRDSASGDAIAAKGLVSSKLKRNIDHVFGFGKLGEIRLPSGQHTGVKSGSGSSNGLTIVKNNRRYLVTDEGVQVLDPPDTKQPGSLERKLQKMLLRYYPGGIVEFDPDGVLASTEAIPYDVLPQQAGLLQLAKQGAMTQTPDGYFKIVEPIPRFPAGLNGGHSVRFIISTGVPMPGGSPGHSTVIMEEDGTCVAGHRCP